MVAVLPPQTNSEPPPNPGEVPVCLTHPDEIATWTSPIGTPFCQACKDSWFKLGLDQMYPESAYKYDPVDLDELLASEPPTEDWYVEPLFPRGKLVGITSSAGHGKSLLLLDVACKKATGEAILEQAASIPEHVAYLDMEQGPDELYDRLNDLGYSRDHPLWATLTAHLHYYQLMPLPPLNTQEGGEALEEIIDRHQATFLIIDTLARVIAGNENDAEPYQELFRHTETMLKRRAITLVRLDHLGKDTSKGSRGSSAKIDGLDVMWQMEQVIHGTMQFKRTKGRQPWVAEHATIHRTDTAGIVGHSTLLEAVPPKILDLVDLMDRLGMAPDTGTPTAQRLLKEAGQGKQRADIRAAVRYRKGRLKVRPPSDHPPRPPDGPPPPLFPKSHTTQGEQGQTTPQTTLDQSGWRVSPPKGGPPPDQAETFLLDDDFDSDPADLPNPYEED